MKIQIDNEVMEATPEQIEEINKTRTGANMAKIIEEKQKDRLSALAKLVDLGLTEKEIAAL